MGARNMMPTSEGFQLVSRNGVWMRAVKTVDGGYCIFSTNGSSRLFPTPMGFGFQGVSNDERAVTMTRRGFAIRSQNGTVEMEKAGSSWIDVGSTDNVRVIVSQGAYSTVSGPLAPMPADTAYELFQRRQGQEAHPEQQFQQPANQQPHPVPIRLRTNLDGNQGR